MQEPMLSDTMLFQGPMKLAEALFCLDCEVMFTSLESCPSCAGSTVWPVATWLSPAHPSPLVASRPVVCALIADLGTEHAGAVAWSAVYETPLANVSSATEDLLDVRAELAIPLP